MDSNYIKARIREQGLTQGTLADKINMTEGTLSLKINGKAVWTRDEMLDMARELHTDVNELFFRD